MKVMKEKDELVGKKVALQESIVTLESEEEKFIEDLAQSEEWKK